MQHEKNSPVGALILATLFAVPGFVTWVIALDDSGSFDDDWVVLCMPLLLLAAASLGYAGKRAFGALGFAAGLLAGLGVTGGLFYVLAGKIEGRQAYQDQRRSLEATGVFCEGGARAFPEAPAFRQGARGSMLVYTRTDGRTTRSYSPEFLDWSPSPPHIHQTTLVACVENVDADVEECRYSGGRSLRRVRRDRRVQLFSLQTGALVVEVALPGSQPDGCAIIEEFSDVTGQALKAGSTPGNDTVATFLRSYIAP